MTADRWTQAVRQQLALGRLLPLGGPRDGAWIAERAAGTVLRRAAGEVPGVRLDTLRIALADPEGTYDPAVPAPPSGLPPGPLRLSAEFAATASQPLPTTAALLRTALTAAAAERIGLAVTEVDLRVAALLDEDDGNGQDGQDGHGGGRGNDGGHGDGGEGGRAEDAEGAEPAAARPPGASRDPQDRIGPADPADPADPAAGGSPGSDESRVAAAALAVPGVSRLTGALGGTARAVHIEERRQEAALPGRHVRVELAVSADHRALDVAREVRAAVARALPDHPTVAVLVTAVG
ncbi:nucleopolyhedrovirus P10 family protein [Streptomyces sp. NPDC052701]|uniref:nucleopolyhedrovirus P10 family protein n=1 Tax=Streptomyces sp. NPDC052701 TaxID=3155533 RepID=UPI0034151FBE